MRRIRSLKGSLIHDLRLSPTSQHGVHNELTILNVTHTAQRDVNSVENDRLVTLVTLITATI